MKSETRITVPIPQKVEQQIIAKFFGISIDKVKRDRYNFHIEDAPVDELNRRLRDAGIEDTND